MPDETWTRDGSKRVELFIPFEFNKKKIDAITFKPFTLGMQDQWWDGRIREARDLMVRMCGLPKEALAELTYVDIERVNMAYVSMLPRDIIETLGRRAEDIATPGAAAPGPTVPLSPLQSAPNAQLPEALPPSVNGAPPQWSPPAPAPESSDNTGFDING